MDNLTKIIELCWNNQFLSLFMPNRGLIFRWWTTALCWPTSAPRSTPRLRLTIPTTRNLPTGTKGRRSKTRKQPSLKTGTRTRPNSFLTHRPPSQTVKPLFSLLRFFLTSAFILFGPRRTPTFNDSVDTTLYPCRALALARLLAIWVKIQIRDYRLKLHDKATECPWPSLTAGQRHV